MHFLLCAGHHSRSRNEISIDLPPAFITPAAYHHWLLGSQHSSLCLIPGLPPQISVSQVGSRSCYLFLQRNLWALFFWKLFPKSTPLPNSGHHHPWAWLILNLWRGRVSTHEARIRTFYIKGQNVYQQWIKYILGFYLDIYTFIKTKLNIM